MVWMVLSWPHFTIASLSRCGRHNGKVNREQLFSNLYVVFDLQIRDLWGWVRGARRQQLGAAETAVLHGTATQ